MSDLKTFIKRRLKHAENRVDMFKKNHGDDPGKTHTYWGGYDLGYWQGKAYTYQLILDKMEESECQKH